MPRLIPQSENQVLSRAPGPRPRLRRLAGCRRHPRTGSFTAILALLFLAPACQHADNTWLVTGRDESPAAPAPAHQYVYPAQAPVVTVDDLRAFVARFQGRTVVLDVWADWNRRCREEMIQLSQLQEDAGRAGQVQVVSLNLDGPDQWQTTTVPTLHGASANFPCLVLDRDSRTALRAWLGDQWGYDLPARFVIAPDGRVRSAYCGEAAIDAAVADARTGTPGPGRAIVQQTRPDAGHGDMNPEFQTGANAPTTAAKPAPPRIRVTTIDDRRASGGGVTVTHNEVQAEDTGRNTSAIRFTGE